jgi:hypothetical protein
MRPSVIARIGCAIAAAVAVVVGTEAQTADYDLLVRNGCILDGTGNPFYVAVARGLWPSGLRRPAIRWDNAPDVRPR